MATNAFASRSSDATRNGTTPRWVTPQSAREFLAITPLETPDIPLTLSLLRHDTLVALDIGRDASRWPDLLATLDQRAPSSALPRLGIRIPDGVSIESLPQSTRIGFVIVSGNQPGLNALGAQLPVIAQVCTVQEAETALAAGAVGLISKGMESGGRCGHESSFILLQRVLDVAASSQCPVWCQGGIGPHASAAAISAGAAGVVIDTALLNLQESRVGTALRNRLLQLDGSEIREVAGYQVLPAPGTEVTRLDSLEADEVRAALAAGHLLPVGQDAALLAALAADSSSAEVLFNTLRTRIAGQLRQARQLRSLEAGAPWAAAHGVRYPIAQGPMTRVSDTAAFCEAVATEGALPFLALSLMSGDACEKLLAATQERLGTQPWGVGVLGFAAPEVLNPQLELIKRYRPAALLIAGGRPSQARPFVELGIPTYLHVPSPGLLELFLKDGARHFIFEGRECGGHVGPRFSLVLWEQALRILLQFDRPESLHILFAGGIHDARSAAMVATLAAPLAARGAKIGVLMGTAYIATQEAVSCGAVLPNFQDHALAGDHTVLVETAPGHAIRCLQTGFVDLFHREKNLLTRTGLEQKAIWSALEELTVGRLRIATKGVERQGSGLVPVDTSRQHAEGMFMIGQAIALVKQPCRIADLHQAVSEGAVAWLDQLPLPAAVEQGRAEPIAVVGMACIYPGAPDLEAFWATILEGHDAVSEVPAERWNAERYYEPNTSKDGKTPSKWGGFIEATPFDPLRFGIPPQSLAAIEPAQLLALKVAADALRDAGYEDRHFDREKAAVIFGAEAGMDLAHHYHFRNLFPQFCGDLPPELDAALPRLTEDSFPGVLVNVISGRIANRLGLGGVNYAVDSACASSLTAIELATKELRAGTSDMVLAGGADFHNGVSDFLMFASVGALSPSGRCRSFDNSADGIALGEGVGVVVLKRLSDAERDNDRIYAVIEGIAGSSDGKGLGLTAPRPEGQKRALRRAYWQAGRLPADVGLVEAHGTGTVVGDRTELKALTEVYNEGGASASQTALGSVKSQIGHTKCAAGIAGLIKVSKALHHRVLPPTRQLRTPNAWYSAASSPFQLNVTAQPWLGSEQVAAVSAFGFGGANFHAVLSAHPDHQAPVGARRLPAELFAIRGHSPEEALQQLRGLSHFLTHQQADVALADVAAALWQAGKGPVQCAFVAGTVAQLRQRLAKALQHSTDEGIQWHSNDESGKLACLFPGQGSQYPGMLRELFVYFPALHAYLQPGLNYLEQIFPAAAFDDNTRQLQVQALTDTRRAQPALAMIEMALFGWLRSMGLQPDMAAGHSFGELAALASAGAFDTATLVELAQRRAEAILGAAGDDPGTMAAVSLGADALRSLLADFPDITLANQNSPVQTVISGPTARMTAAREFLRDRQVACKPIDTACAFHSPLLATAEPAFAKALAGVNIGPLAWPVYSNELAAPHANTANSIKAALARHVVSPVRFVAEIERMVADGARTFVEVGPRRVLGGLLEKILKHQPHRVISLDHESKGLAGLFEALAQLAVVLPAFDAAPLFAGRTRPLDLAAPHALPASTWMVNGGRAWPLHGEPPAHAGRPLTRPVAAQQATATVMPAGDNQQAIISYLNTMRDMVSAQRDVLMSFFGQAPVARTPAVTTTIPASAPVSAALPAATPAREQSTDLSATLLGLVSERTGYPAAMLDLDLDLEADLSIDSIKRLEIVGELSQRLALRERLGEQADRLTEQLSSQKTLRAMLSWLASHLPQTAAPAAAAQPADALLIRIISQSTGYPPESLEPDLDLEADLSIDSIKRLEIISQLAEQLALDEAGRDALQEGLATLKTLRAMADWLRQELPAPAPVASVTAINERGDTAVPLSRYVMRLIAQPPAPRLIKSFQGQRFLLTNDGSGLADRLAASLTQLGAEARIIDFSEQAALPGDFGNVDGLIHLWSVHPDNRVRDVKRFFGLLRQLASPRLRHLLVASGLGGEFGLSSNGGPRADFGQGAGLAGMIKTVAKEYTTLRAQWVDLDLSESAQQLTDHLLAELTGPGDLTEVSYRGGQRFSRRVEADDLDHALHEGLPLDKDSVVLVTGGARGITARIAIALARRYHCRLELVGRSAEPPEQEDTLTRDLRDSREIRQALVAAHPGQRPAEIERLTRETLAAREFRATIAAIRAAGSEVSYTQLDVRDIDTFASFIESLYLMLGRIDGVIHGAGIVEDKLLQDKSPESFTRVFDTKVRGALMLNKLIRDDVKFVVFFSSVASAFGNRGQIDYASANDVLDKLAHAWQTRITGRVLSVNWGPWADTGMVNAALEREYARKGIGLIPQDQGVAALLRELGSAQGETQVVLMCGTPESMGETPSGVLP